MEEACAALAGDALHYMSLGSKELFHSNFLGWFAASYPAQAAAAFADLIGEGDPGKGPVVERERGDLDLILRLPGLRPAVIENKVWSLPDDTQLERYATGQISKLKSDCASILLSLTPPLWDGPTRTLGGRTWTYVSYQELAERLRRAGAELEASADADERFAGELICRYVRMVGHVQKAVAAAAGGRPDDPAWLGVEVRQLAQSVRIDDGLSKLRAHQALAHLVKDLRDRGLVTGEAALDEARSASLPVASGWKHVRLGDRVIGLEAGFSRKEPLLSGLVMLEGGDGLWWQYQGRSWRLAVTSTAYEGRGPVARAKRHAYIDATYDRWFDFSAVAALVGAERAVPVPAPKGEIFHRYDPSMAYRQTRVDTATAQVTLAQLAVLAGHYLQTAISWA
jgi:hypothetical protein